MSEIALVLKDVTLDNFAAYGSLIDVAAKKPNASSAVFDYWDGLGEVDAEGRVSLGLVGSHPSPLVATNLERHLKTSETLIPMTEDIVLVVAKPSRTAEADTSSAAAFRVPLGKAVTLKPGTWHYVPMNAERETKTMVVFRAGTPGDDLLVDDFSKTRGLIIKVGK